MFYSKLTNGFYTPEIHGENIPGDAVEVTDAQYQALFEGQGAGKQIQGDENGHPILVDAPLPEPTPAPTKEELMAKLLEIQAQLENI
jgi:hypothetical protein